MERFFVMIILVGGAWAFDQFAFNGWYTVVASQDASYEAQQLCNDVNSFLNQYHLVRNP